MKSIARDAFTFGVLLLLPGWLAAEPVITIHASGLLAARVLRYHTAGQFSDDVTVMVLCP